MTKVIDFYFDFISPYSFLAHKRIVKIQKNENIKYLTAKQVMKRKPISVEKNMLAAKALSIMNTKKITSLCVNNDKNLKKTIGIIHIHNILEANVS